jgi:hypothetical protein
VTIVSESLAVKDRAHEFWLASKAGAMPQLSLSTYLDVKKSSGNLLARRRCRGRRELKGLRNFVAATILQKTCSVKLFFRQNHLDCATNSDTLGAAPAAVPQF